MNSSHLEWGFPLPRPYTGVHLANGVLGLLVWGAERLSLTVGRTGFWDRRGAVPFASRIDFITLRRLLESGEKTALEKAFADPPLAVPYRTPTQIPGGRLDLYFADGVRPRRARLELASGTLEVILSDKSILRVRLSPGRELAWIECGAAPLEKVELVPAWHYLAPTLAGGGVAAPETWGNETSGGFYQSLPADPGLSIAWHRRAPGWVTLVTALGGAEASELARAFAREADVEAAGREAGSWWDTYWLDVPRVRLPDPALQRHWDYGLVKQAGLTPPQGLPATLQGPWMAEDALPSWSNDYHFNINVQMVYWPALPTNRADHLWPMWEMIGGWLPALRANAAKFFRASDALMLPHAVDDRGQVIGNFWQGTIDHACTAWMAQLAWSHYRHTLDTRLLREIAWPLLTGAFGGFWAMMEEIEDEGRRRLSLPVTVSPEYGEWGRDSSFQLAAAHCIARILPRAAAALGERTDPRWARVREELPLGTIGAWAPAWGLEGHRPRLLLWRYQDLPESHRHHSHLAGLHPFDVFDLNDEAQRDLVKRSLEHWTKLGPGNWVGWSMPWAAMLWARADEASAAVSVLRIWEDVFTNLGGGTLHNADSLGYSNWVHGPFLEPWRPARSDDQMQMDASMGFLQAVIEILVQQRGERLHVLPSLPKQWRELEFDGVLVEGGFLVGATVERGNVREVRIISKLGAPLNVVLPRNGEWRVSGEDKGVEKGVFARSQTRPGASWSFTAEGID